MVDLTRVGANIGYRFRARRHPADLIVGFDLDGVFLARSGTPYVVALKGVMADEARYETGWQRLRFRLLSRLERRNARRADRVLVTSDHSRGVALAAYGLAPERVRVVPEGIDLESWPEGGSRGDPAGGAPSIVTIARQYRRKNTAVLVRAMEKVRAAVPGVRLRIIGDGPEVPRLKDLIAKLKLGDAVTLVGSVRGVEDIRRELWNADVFCLPSRQEGFGIVFLEAMASGLPIVAARCAAVPETAPHGEVSLLVDPDDVEGLATALIRLLRDEDLRLRLSSAGAVRCRRFGWEDVAGRFLASVGHG